MSTYISSGGTSAWVNIGTLGGPQTQPTAINNRGQIVGFSDNAADTVSEPFFYSGGTMTAIPLGPFVGGGNAFGLNDEGVVVGSAAFAGDIVSHAYVWYGSGSMEDLNGLIDPSLDWTLDSANAVNDLGVILASGYQPGGPDHALLLTPVPEPFSLSIICVGAAIALLASTRRLRNAPAISPKHFQHTRRVRPCSDFDGCAMFRRIIWVIAQMLAGRREANS